MKFQQESEEKARKGEKGEEGEGETLARGSNDTVITSAENPLSYTYVCLRNAVLVILEFSNSRVSSTNFLARSVCAFLSIKEFSRKNDFSS